jgi:hypothetical protein
MDMGQNEIKAQGEPLPNSPAKGNFVFSNVIARAALSRSKQSPVIFK